MRAKGQRPLRAELAAPKRGRTCCRPGRGGPSAIAGDERRRREEGGGTNPAVLSLLDAVDLLANALKLVDAFHRRKAEDEDEAVATLHV